MELNLTKLFQNRKQNYHYDNTSLLYTHPHDRGPLGTNEGQERL
jgi:hypothetical protein